MSSKQKNNRKVSITSVNKTVSNNKAKAQKDDWDEWDEYEFNYTGHYISEYMDKMDREYDNKWHPSGKVNYWSPDAMEERSLGFSTF